MRVPRPAGPCSGENREAPAPQMRAGASGRASARPLVLLRGGEGHRVTVCLVVSGQVFNDGTRDLCHSPLLIREGSTRKLQGHDLASAVDDVWVERRSTRGGGDVIVAGVGLHG